MTHFSRASISMAIAFLMLPFLASAARVNISILDGSFSPKNATLSPGDSVVWTNNGNAPHTVTADTGAFGSSSISPGQTFQVTFTATSSYRYYSQGEGSPGGVGMSGTLKISTGDISDVNTYSTGPAQAVTLGAGGAVGKTSSVGTSGSTGSVTNVATATGGSGATTADVAARTQALLAQVTALQKQLGVTGSGAPYVDDGSCPAFTRSLAPGSSGTDVAKLQAFLARDSSLYPEANLSGYYGALTQAAVQRFQVANSIVSSGTPGTTGYGAVGTRTAAAVVKACGSGSSSITSGSNSSSGSSVPAAVGGYIQVTPIVGSAPLGVQAIATVNTTNSCDGATYILDWGDRSAPQFVNVAAGNCAQVSQAFSHVYLGGGAFRVSLSAGTHQTSAVVTVYGSSGTIVPIATQTDTFAAYPQTGGAPLTVSFTGTLTTQNPGWCSSGCYNILDFGDGKTAQVALPVSQGGVQNYSISHAYAAGTYTATMYEGQTTQGPPKLGSVTITSIGGTLTGISTGTTGSTGSVPSTFSPLSMTQSATNALSITAQFDLSGCPAFSLDWGDGSTPVSANGGCPGGSNTQLYQHTYPNKGPFTLVLRRAGQTDTAFITLAN